MSYNEWHFYNTASVYTHPGYACMLRLSVFVLLGWRLFVFDAWMDILTPRPLNAFLLHSSAPGCYIHYKFVHLVSICFSLANVIELETILMDPPASGVCAVTAASSGGFNLFPTLTSIDNTPMYHGQEVPYVSYFTRIKNLRVAVAQQNTVVKDLEDNIDNQNERIKKLEAEVAHQNTELKNLADKIHARDNAQNARAKLNEWIANLGAEVAQQNTANEASFQHQKNVMQTLSGKIHSIQHGMCAHFQKGLDDLADRVYLHERVGRVPEAMRVDTKMPVPSKCAALSLSECTHGPACDGGVLGHKTV